MKAFKVGVIYQYYLQANPCYFLYIGDSDNSNEILCAEVGPINGKPHYTLDGKCDYLCVYSDTMISVSRNYSIRPLFIRGSEVSLSSDKLQQLIDDLINIEIDVYKNEMLNTSKLNYDSSSAQLKNIVLPEKISRLLKWNLKKKYLRFDKKPRQMVENCFKYNAYFAYLGTNIGSEIEKLRPVIIWREHVNKVNPIDNSYYVFPISSKIPKKPYYYNVEIMVNGQKNIVKINDGRRISGLRIEKPLKDDSTGNTYILSDQAISNIKEAIKKYFKL